MNVYGFEKIIFGRSIIIIQTRLNPIKIRLTFPSQMALKPLLKCSRFAHTHPVNAYEKHCFLAV